MGVGLAKWNIMTRHVNCSAEIQCQLIVEPEIDPHGFTAQCSDHWTTRYTPCWNECRKNVDIGGFPFSEICSFCCEGELCNVPPAFGYPLPENTENTENAKNTENAENAKSAKNTDLTDVTDVACAPNTEFTLWFMVTVILLSFFWVWYSLHLVYTQVTLTPVSLIQFQTCFLYFSTVLGNRCNRKISGRVNLTTYWLFI